MNKDLEDICYQIRLARIAMNSEKVKECLIEMDEYFQNQEQEAEESYYHEPHTCPYREEIGGDYETLCTCSPEETSNCIQEI